MLFRSYAGDRKLRTTADPFGRIAIEVPEHTDTIRVTYEIEWTTAAVSGLLMVFAGLLLQWARPFPARVRIPVPVGAPIG